MKDPYECLLCWHTPCICDKLRKNERDYRDWSIEKLEEFINLLQRTLDRKKFKKHIEKVSKEAREVLKLTKRREVLKLTKRKDKNK